MTDFIIYLLKSSIVLSVFYAFYIVFLRKETFYNLNRAYLLGALFISFILPFVHIQVEKPLNQIENNFVYAGHAFLEVVDTLELVEMPAVENVNTYPVIFYVFLLGMIISTIRVGFQFISIYKNVKKHGIETQGRYKYVLMNKDFATHSFFNFIFVQKSEYSDPQRKEVLLHEQVHADKWHSLDLLIVGFLSVLQWFNPFIFLLKRTFTETHEFQADQTIIDGGADRLYYQQLLFLQAKSVVFAGLTSNFNQSLMKNRMGKNRNAYSRI